MPPHPRLSVRSGVAESARRRPLSIRPFYRSLVARETESQNRDRISGRRSRLGRGSTSKRRGGGSLRPSAEPRVAGSRRCALHAVGGPRCGDADRGQVAQIAAEPRAPMVTRLARRLRRASRPNVVRAPSGGVRVRRWAGAVDGAPSARAAFRAPRVADRCARRRRSPARSPDAGGSSRRLGWPPPAGRRHAPLRPPNPATWRAPGRPWRPPNHAATPANHGQRGRCRSPD